MKITLIIAVLLVLAGCTQAIEMRNPRTGEITTCGPYTESVASAMREAQCIQDYKEQGFVRVPD